MNTNSKINKGLAIISCEIKKKNEVIDSSTSFFFWLYYPLEF